MKTIYVTFYGSICRMNFHDDAAAQLAYETIKEALDKWKAFSRNESADTVEVKDGHGNPATYRLERMDSVMISGVQTEDELREIVMYEAGRRKVYEECGVPYPGRDRPRLET
jgi:hypothetical protein